jgi:hypothetical protein
VELAKNNGLDDQGRSKFSRRYLREKSEVVFAFTRKSRSVYFSEEADP